MVIVMIIYSNNHNVPYYTQKEIFSVQAQVERELQGTHLKVYA
jgi:hypothetical protein